MKNKFIKNISSLAFIGAFASMMVGCDIPEENTGMASLSYSDISETPSVGNSWEYMGDEEITINWYVDVSSWVIPTGFDEVSKEIKRIPVARGLKFVGS